MTTRYGRFFSSSPLGFGSRLRSSCLLHSDPAGFVMLAGLLLRVSKIKGTMRLPSYTRILVVRILWHLGPVC